MLKHLREVIMHTQTHQDNTGQSAPHLVLSGNVARNLSMNSREIADLCEKRHDHVIRDIRQMIEELSKDAPILGYVEEMDARMYTASFELNRELTETLITGYSIKLRNRVIKRLHELESRNTVTLPDFSNPALAARAWAEQFELNQAANEALAIAAPKVDFVDRYVESTGLKGFRQTAKLLGANEARFREFLLDKKIIYRLGGEWQAYQQHVDAGRFSVKTGASDSGHAYNQVKFTPKGVSWIAGLWAQHNIEGNI